MTNSSNDALAFPVCMMEFYHTYPDNELRAKIARAEAVRGKFSVNKRPHPYEDSGEGWCLTCGEPSHD